MKKTTLIIAAGAAFGAAFGAALAAKAVSDFQRDKRVAFAVLRGRSQVIDTARGPIEYAAVGDGPAVLLVHGAGGGYDQSLAIARLFGDGGFKFIAVSRPGYLRTPLASGRTPEDMADLYAALLDALKIERAAIVGMSAGGPSSLQFALRHPDRCRALVMTSAINQTLPALPDVIQILQPTLNTSDIGVWLLGKFAWRFLVRVLGVGPELMRQVEQSPEKIAAIHAIASGPASATMSVRRAGVLNDVEMIIALPFPPVEALRAPTLIVHARNDPLVPFAQGQMLADRVPGAQLVALDDGGHLAIITHSERIAPQFFAFLSGHVA